MTTDELNTKVLKLLIEHLKHEKKDDKNAEILTNPRTIHQVLFPVNQMMPNARRESSP